MPVDPAPMTDGLVDKLRFLAERLDGEDSPYSAADCLRAIGRIEALETALSRARAEAFEEAARWHEREAQFAMSSLHCGADFEDYRAARQAARFHKGAAKHLHSLATKGDQARPASCAQTPAEGGTRDG